MRTLLPFLSVMCLSVSLALHAAPTTPKVNPESQDLGADVEAKISKAKAKQGTVASGNKNSKEGCGNVNINSDTKKSSGSGGLIGEQKTTVIVGDVINTAKCK